MNIVVLVKEVPDTAEDRALHPETGLTDRANARNMLDESCERALELALLHADTHADTNVAVLCVAPQHATTTLRRTLAMGADTATHIVDDGLIGADLGLIAETLAAVLREREVDLVIAGAQSTDGGSGMLPTMLAELLDLPALTELSDVTIEADQVTAVQTRDERIMRVRAALPAIISVTEALPPARIPNFKGITAAKKKPVTVQNLTELGIDPNDLSTARSIMLEVAKRAPRVAGIKIVDEGDAAQRIAAFLVERRLL